MNFDKLTSLARTALAAYLGSNMTNGNLHQWYFSLGGLALTYGWSALEKIIIAQKAEEDKSYAVIDAMQSTKKDSNVN